MDIFQSKQKVMNNQDFQNILKRIDSLKVDLIRAEDTDFNEIYFPLENWKEIVRIVYSLIEIKTITIWEKYLDNYSYAGSWKPKNTLEGNSILQLQDFFLQLPSTFKENEKYFFTIN
jgi:hypothetical protein